MDDEIYSALKDRGLCPTIVAYERDWLGVRVNYCRAMRAQKLDYGFRPLTMLYVALKEAGCADLAAKVFAKLRVKIRKVKLRGKEQ